MELNHVDGEEEDMGREPSALRNVKEHNLYRSRYPGAVRQKAYIFDGEGNYYNKEWDLMEGFAPFDRSKNPNKNMAMEKEVWTQQPVSNDTCAAPE